MGLRVYYNYNGTILDSHKAKLQPDLDTTNGLLDELWAELLAMAAATPPAEITTEAGGTRYPYTQWLAAKMLRLRYRMEEYYTNKTHIEDCLRTLEENPESVRESD